MGAHEPERQVSRRTFLGWAGGASAAAAASGLGFAAPAAAGRRRKLQVFKLDAEGKGYHCGSGGDCRGCKACRRHAKNKLFPSEKAARDHRAHVGCRCGVVGGGKLPRKTWKKLFGPPGNRKHDQVDLRNPKVKKILAEDGN